MNEKNINTIIHGKKIDFNEESSSDNEEKNSNNNHNVIKQNNSFNQIININNIHNKNTLVNKAYISVKPLNNNNNTGLNLLKIKCTCSKTGCLKKYCACFANGIACDGCVKLYIVDGLEFCAAAVVVDLEGIAIVVEV